MTQNVQNSTQNLYSETKKWKKKDFLKLCAFCCDVFKCIKIRVVYICMM